MHIQKRLEVKFVPEGEIGTVSTENRSTTLHQHELVNEEKDNDQCPRKWWYKTGTYGRLRLGPGTHSNCIHARA